MSSDDTQSSDDLTTVKSSYFHQKVKEVGGAIIFAARVLELLGALALLGISIVQLVLVVSPDSGYSSGVPVSVHIILCVVYVRLSS